MSSYNKLQKKLVQAKSRRTQYLGFMGALDLDCDDDDDFEAFKTKHKGKDLEQLLRERIQGEDDVIANLTESIEKLLIRQGQSCMQPALAAISPSAQAASGMDKEVAKEAFYSSVQDVTSVVGDSSVLRSLLIARNPTIYTLAANLNVDKIAEKLHQVSKGDFYKSPDSLGRPKKFAKVSGRGINITDNLECEDTRSANFAIQWNVMLMDLVGVMAIPQLVTRKDRDNTINKSDVVLAKITQDKQNPENSSVVDYSIVIEWKCNPKEGADREGSQYAMQLKDATGRNKFLVLSVASSRVEVFGLYWVESAVKASRVKLAQYESLSSCLKKWLPAFIWFIHESGESLVPRIPRLSIEATESSTWLKGDVYKVEIKGTSVVYKVFDYVNRCSTVSRNDRRWMNWELVSSFYPNGVKMITSGEGLDIFTCPFLEGGIRLHVPKSKEQFMLAGEELRRLHSLNYVHGDVRLANMLFPQDVQQAYIIDFDFSRKLDTNNPPRYVDGYQVEHLPRHSEAKSKHVMKQVHDVHSFWLCYSTVCGIDTATSNCPYTTMSDLLGCIRDNTFKLAVDDPSKIDELNIKTGTPDRPTLA